MRKGSRELTRGIRGSSRNIVPTGRYSLFASQGTAVLSNPSFMLLFNDLGAGVASLVPDIGNGPATFTRASSAFTVNSAGILVSVGNNVPRSWYDPATLAYRGFLAEGAATNLLLRSQEFDNASWAKTEITVGANSTAAPDLTVTADSLVEGAAGTFKFVSQVAAKAATALTYTLSVWAKRGVGVRDIRLIIADDATGTNGALVIYNTATGAVITVPTLLGAGFSAPSSTAKQYPNGWWKFSLTVTSNLAVTLGSIINLINAGAASYAGDGASSLVLWGAQLEQLSHYTSYIATAAAQASRAADFLTYPLQAGLIGNVGCYYAEGFVEFTPGSVGECFLSVSDGTSLSIMAMLSNAGGFQSIIQDNAQPVPPQMNILQGAGQQAANTVLKVCTSWDISVPLGGFFLSKGLAENIGTDAAIVIPIAKTVIEVGSYATGQFNFDGAIKNIRIWRQFLPFEFMRLIPSP